MNSGGAPAGEPEDKPPPSNAAWATAAIPLSARDAFMFLGNIERLFRLNPHLDISDWRQQPGQRPCYRISALNESNGCRCETTMSIADVRENRGITLLYDESLKASTEFRIEPCDGGSSLTITEHYHPVEDHNDARLKEVDRSLVPWLAAIREHLCGLARYGWLPGYRWWVGHFMPGMPPRQRRIVRMIVWASAIEFAVFLLLAAIFWLEWPGG